MQPMAYNRNKYSGELYKSTRESVGSNTVVKYYFADSISLNASIDKSGRMTIKTEEPLALGWLVANVKDANGNPILDDMVWQINGLEPILNAFNTIEGYKQKAVKFQGTI